jgi:transposase-like protein
MLAASREVIHLNLRGRRPHALVQDEEDWHALSAIAERMLFWCGGSIHGCRCEGREMRFAVTMQHASVGAAAHHIAGAYAVHLRRRRGWSGRIFNHYVAIPIDAELFLDDLVLWLHRPQECAKAEGAGQDVCWTADSAYLKPKSLSWITTDRVLAALSPGGAGRSAYIRLKTQPIPPEIAATLTGRAALTSRTARRAPQALLDVLSRRAIHRREDPAPSIETIARFVADYCHLSYEDLRCASRKRTVSRAKAVAAVLCSRNGASVAAVARLFGRSRSTLIERAERYHETLPHLFAQAERALDAHLEREHGRHDPQSVWLSQTHADRHSGQPAGGMAIHAGNRAHEIEDGIALGKP